MQAKRALTLPADELIEALKRLRLDAEGGLMVPEDARRSSVPSKSSHTGRCLVWREEISPGQVEAGCISQAILAELNERSMSPSRYAEEFNLDQTKICRHFSRLEQLGYLEVVEEVSGGRRGAPERIFRATQVALFDTAMWERLPEPIRRDYSGVIWETYGRRVNQAFEAGTLDADVDRHLSWKPLRLDRLGWTQFVTGLDDHLDRVMDIEVESAERMAETGEEPITATVGLAGFRSPKTASRGTLCGRNRPEMAEFVALPKSSFGSMKPNTRTTQPLARKFPMEAYLKPKRSPTRPARQHSERLWRLRALGVSHRPGSLHADPAALRCLAFDPLGDRLGAVFVQRADEQESPTMDDRPALILELLGEAQGVVARRKVDPNLEFGSAALLGFLALGGHQLLVLGLLRSVALREWPVRVLPLLGDRVPAPEVHLEAPAVLARQGRYHSTSLFCLLSGARVEEDL